MRRNNRRLYRVARAVVRDAGEAEDVLQDAYLKAFAALASFRGDASLSTWLTRITLNEALQRRRRQHEPVSGAAPAAQGPARQDCRWVQRRIPVRRRTLHSDHRHRHRTARGLTA